MARQLTQSELDEFNTRQRDMIQQISDIQNIEMGMYQKLASNVSNKGSQTERDNLVMRIQTLSDSRMDMYRDLMDNYAIIRQSVGQTRGDLTDQLALIDIAQQQLDALRKQTGQLGDGKLGKERMIEINTYYGKKYAAQKELMQIIVLTCVPLLILALLAKFGTLAGSIASAIGSVVLVIGLYFIIRKFIDINTRSNMVFDEYDWQFDPAALKPTVIEYDIAQLKGAMPTVDVEMGGCFGQACCAKGTVYDETLSKCVVPKAGAGSSAKPPAASPASLGAVAPAATV